MTTAREVIARSYTFAQGEGYSNGFVLGEAHADEMLAALREASGAPPDAAVVIMPGGELGWLERPLDDNDGTCYAGGVGKIIGRVELFEFGHIDADTDAEPLYRLRGVSGE